MATRDGLQERIRTALRTDAQFYRGIAELKAADEQLRSVTERFYVGKHDVATGESAAHKSAVVAPTTVVAPSSAAERRLTTQLAMQVEDSRGLAARLKRCRRWLIAVSILLVLVAAGAGVLGYLQLTQN
jgi:hypothetical protein